jgi:hypothetical protein
MPATKQPDQIVQPVMSVVAGQDRQAPAPAADKQSDDAYVARVMEAKAEMRARARQFPEPPTKPAA